MTSASQLLRGPGWAVCLVLVGASAALAQVSSAPPGVDATAASTKATTAAAVRPAAATPAAATAAAATPAAATAAAASAPSTSLSAPLPDDLSSPAWAEGQAAEEMSFGWVLIRTLLVLGMVLALVYLSLNFGLRRLMGIKGVPGGHASVLSLLERLPLDQKRSLFVIKAAGEYLLVGGGDGALALIAKLDTAEVERLQREKTATPLALSPFLQKLLTRRGGPPPPSA